MGKARKILKYEYPELFKLVHEDSFKKLSINFENLGVSSATKIFWTCEKQHKYLRAVRSAVYFKGKTRCGICDNSQIQPGVNDLFTIHGFTKNFWDFEKNFLKPSETAPSSTRDAWWRCSDGHSFERKIQVFTATGGSCPVCLGTVLNPGVNDLATVYPSLKNFWNSDKNVSEMCEVKASRSESFFWKCVNGHEEFATVEKLLNRNHPCLKCSKRRADVDIRQFERDEFFAWFDTDKNFEKFSEYSFRSNEVVWWVCAENHSFERKVLTHLGLCGARCPQCVQMNQASITEREVGRFIETLTSETVFFNVKNVCSKELDVYIPELGLAVEFNGDYWHSKASKNIDWITYHQEKFSEAFDKGILLGFIWEHDWVHHKPVVMKNLLNFIEKRELSENLKTLSSVIDVERSCCVLAAKSFKEKRSFH